ncbi:hypothetical protein [Streptomyces sp. NPDC047130]|uniref:hypothetical protein n=1 Tax=Streptomyces sp. NPDC047130 TaxID=3155261 RepID=UPI00340AB9EE
MTSTQDTAGHPDVTEISELVEGVLAPDRTVSVREHLDDCALCADVRAALEEIRCSLGTLPGPVRMPADVAGRIDAALAAEALLSASDSGTAPAPTSAPAPAMGATHTSATTRRRRTDVSRETSPSSAATGERSAGAAGSHPARRTGSTGPGRDGRATPRSRAARRRTLALGTVLAAGALGIGVLLTQPFQEDPASPAAASFSGRPLDQQVTGLLTEAGRSQESSPQPRTMIRPAVEVPSCIRAGIARTEDAVAAQKGRFDGKDAYLVLLPDPEADSRVTAYVVDASCIRESSAGKETEGDVLLKRSYARSSD